MLTEQKQIQSKTAAPSHQREAQYKYKGIEDVFFTIIVPLSVFNLHIRERPKSNAYWNRVENKERQGEMLTLSLCVNRL